MATALTTLLPLMNVPKCPQALRLQALRNACRRFCRDTEWWRAEVPVAWAGKAVVQVSGAGSSEVDGYYILDEATNRYDKLGDSAYYIQSDAPGWSIRYASPGGAVALMYNCTDGDTPDQGTNWTNFGGVGPAPTVSAASSIPLNWDASDTQIIRTRYVSIDGVALDESYWSVDHNGVLTFDPAPAKLETKEVKAQIVLMPTNLANNADDALIRRFEEAISAGAEYELKIDKGSEQDPHPWYEPQGGMLASGIYRDGVGMARMEVYSEMQSGLGHVRPVGGIWL